MPLIGGILSTRGTSWVTSWRLRQRPERIYADRGDNFDKYRRELRAKS
ncbi:hypothetical protein ACLQ28_14795 [Micromonospora sp. DT201]